MKTLCTYVLSIAFLAIANCGVVNAQPGTVYNKYFINQDFDGVSALPAGWSGDAGNSNIFTKGGGAIAFRDGMMVMSGAGGGNRGTQVTVPATDSNEAWTGYTTWFIELDWTVNKGVLGRRNAVHLTFLGNGTQNPNNGTTWYADALFGIYTFGDDLVHYWNMDSETPAFLGGSGPSFNKGAADLAATSALNASTATTLAFATGVTYHITAELDFQNQKVVSLTITEKDNPANTVTVTDKPFLAPTLGGSESAVAVENRKPKNFSVLTCVNTRGSNDGNGDNVDLEAYVDNLQVYVKETSLGQANVTINYKDRDGAVAKPARVIANQEISTIFALAASDKENFTEGTSTFIYDAEATHAANAEKGADGESVTVAAGGVSLDVIFKKSTITAGTYVWTGANGFKWSELDDNFSVNGGPSISYQPGNAVEFSQNVTNKEVELVGNLSLGDQNVTVSAPDYILNGSGRITGTGGLIINAPTVIGIDNRLEQGATISVDNLQLNHQSAATKYIFTSPAAINLKLNTATGNVSGAVELPADGAGELNIDFIGNEGGITSAISNVSTINLTYTSPGVLKSSTWTTQFTATIPDGTQVNAINNVEGGAIAGLGVTKATLRNAKVVLGDSIRLLRYYNEANANSAGVYPDTLYIGELNGPAAAKIEGGFIDGRKATYNFGGLNTDAVFDGNITQFVRADGTSPTSVLQLVKSGTGTWTLGGKLLYTGDLHVTGGTLKLNGKVASSVTAINVDSFAVLLAPDALIEAGEVNINKKAILASGGTFPKLLLDESSLAKLLVSSFTTGSYDVITSPDITATGILDITVDAATKDAKIQLIQSADLSNVGFGQILVNGEDITANTEETEGAEFVWLPETCELLSLVDIAAGISVIDSSKPVRSVDYYTLTGLKVPSATSGAIIKKITYTDGTVKMVKAFVK